LHENHTFDSKTFICDIDINEWISVKKSLLTAKLYVKFYFYPLLNILLQMQINGTTTKQKPKLNIKINNGGNLKYLIHIIMTIY